MTTVHERDWVALEHQYYQGTFKRLPLTLVRGEGVRVWDSEGKEYLDLVAGIAVNVLGYCHPAIIKAVQEQVTQLVHTSNLFYNIPQVELAEQLGKLSGGMRSFFCNSGAEANEAAIKLARKYGRLHRNGAYEVISMHNSFHGRTLATTAATGQPSYQAAWTPLPDGFQQVPLNDLDAVKAATSEKTVAILVEVVQGEGGIWPTTKEFMQGLRQWCDEQNLVLICDEIQAGMGRTGTFFSWEQYGIRPDIVTLAKGLAGGVPIGAMLTGPRTDLFTPGEHGTTFGGNPLACSAGVATLKTILEEKLIENAAQMGAYWHEHLSSLCSKYPIIDSPRGLGLMRAVHVKHELAPALVERAMAHGLLLNNPSKDTIRMIPPLTITRADLDQAAALLERALQDVTASVQ
ncbi:acetylornithine aminotransferase/acetylornithine/N-succinyldiaminopimelate aminotransferase [Thermosporothrix hazakensis]|jgi:acetylornithine aminotransferase/acetylornithine/N-succinyldiaminopimelate aminotransferase|uniref:Acetylornithine aminotransferase n=2 Tax=Thermosporothrix TaxID=768650 RepID=A0A326UQC2_THEHA|nr:acetylornithine transaminase [Thermosporothrix hazakensis]PZW32727.1 acetylornithine aminotransferase/acetylornithine/N-succinyldiaminopimelate aminotransferase [Thermosporothrix hazakensis]BBH87641.1 acetylornithine aminotransferase [Thermosporothrix sp. COM3]GCE50084.1 acetylornithine aminotransferase [Thermosporothrix hazakensis]